ncbi:Pogo transposable element with KRAB domain [Stylophora pistillata]|uniref:Pogo transposable element with KRAB domain n=1 Tax=Stylophora pistillata TaxID=50429 RepID=A0A2B4R4Z0_STYPI|nr:Pogo transposable element with KRAB domain [Stylophora pistillata]
MQTIQALGLKGAPVTAAVINVFAKGIVMANDSTILVEHGGYLSLSYDWGRNVFYRMQREGKKMTMRMATIEKIPVAPGLLKEAKLSSQRKIKTLQAMYSVPEDLILNFDQTPLSYVCSASHTLHKKGEKSVPLVGKGKKKQITGTFPVMMSGLFLPMHLVYEGESPRRLPQGITFPENFNLTLTPNHWSNEGKVIEHLEEVVFPFLVDKRKDLSLPDEPKAILVFDVFKGQKTECVQNNCVSAFVPANMTNYYQPLDLTVNGPAKQFLKGKYQELYATEIAKQSTFHFDSQLWSNMSDFNPQGGETGFDFQETKLPTYWNTSFSEICLGMKIGNLSKFILVKKQASSLYSLIADGHYRDTSLGPKTWKLLIGSEASLQSNCNKEGFNPTSRWEKNAKARIGIIANDEKHCKSCDSRIGFGTGGHGDDSNTCGNEAKHHSDNGDKHIKAMGYILVQ